MTVARSIVNIDGISTLCRFLIPEYSEVHIYIIMFVLVINV
jgi:hypothetical protein